MPNRVIREGIIDSERINMLSEAAEVFYRRLQSIVDDYGCYDARIEMLRVKLYPLRVETVSAEKIHKCMTECIEAGLIRTYTVSGKSYLEILDFGQTIRIKQRKFPPPPGSDMQMISGCDADDIHMRREREKEKNPELNPNPKRNREGEGEFTHARIFEKIYPYVKKNAKRFYPNEFARAQTEALKYQTDHNITEEALKDPAVQKKWDEVDVKIIEKNFGRKMREEIEACIDHYSARNFTIDNQPIENWISVIKGWMNKRDQFKKKTA
jgi:hypothetical protein